MTCANTIDVALATCNGAAFLWEQLDSLKRQALPPDHVVVSDDGSTDNTLEVVEDFRRRAPCRVGVIFGEGRLGPMNTFLRASRAFATEFVAFCDRDDIWMPRKIEVAVGHLFSGISALIHSTRQFSTAGTAPQPPVLLPNRRLDGLDLAPHRMFFGMSMIVRRALLEQGEGLKRAWEKRFEPDAWLIHRRAPLGGLRLSDTTNAASGTDTVRGSGVSCFGTATGECAPI